MTGSNTKKLIQFDKNFFKSENQISYIGNGSEGGKAKGLTFINDVIISEVNTEEFHNTEIGIPKLIIIRTDVFDAFIKDNELHDIAFSETSDNKIAQAFLDAQLPDEILSDLKTIISSFNDPLTIRSSSLLEDNMYEPFSGIYSTKMISNNQPGLDTRFKNLVIAVKYIYASTYFKAAKDYMKATKHKIEEEKMAVMIQEVIGTRFNDSFYPEISGIARSYNYYPVGKAKPEDGTVNLALGLGKTIIDGGSTWAYSPVYPKISPPFGAPDEMMEHTQTGFWAISMEEPKILDPLKENEYLIHRSLIDAEKDGSLKHIVSTYDSSSDSIKIGLESKGPRILTFAPVLVHNIVPINNLLKKLVKVCEKALNAPVEIEFAISFSKDKESECNYRFGFLQVRPMAVTSKVIRISQDELVDDNVFTASENVQGNGEINTIQDIVYINVETFDTKFTKQMAEEIESINKKMIDENRPYLLIGFGRWGTSDPFAGIPAVWGQVSGAKAIIEATFENVYIEMSQASRFFQNLTSFKTFYFSIPFAGNYSIDWDWLTEQQLIEETRFVNHVRTEKPIYIKVDGRSGKGVILKSK